jgi:cyclophilin family peptidyl-prolyl cis-trans isomerase
MIETSSLHLRKRGPVKKLLLILWGPLPIAGVALLLFGCSIGAPAAVASASTAARPSVNVLVPLAVARAAGFTKVVHAASASTSTGVSGCADGAEEELSSASGKIGLVSEVLYCSAPAGATALLRSISSSGQVKAGLHPPKALGTSALERVGSDSSYLIVWRRGAAFELVGLSTNLPTSSTTSTTSGAAVPLTPHEQQVLTNAAIQQNARFKAFSIPTGAAGSGADAKAQAQADAVSVAAGCPKSPTTVLKKSKWSSAPAMTIDPATTYTATVKTDIGTFTIALDAKADPQTVNNFVFLAKHGFYDCVIFHRVIPQFVDQTGDPTGTGSGGPGYTIPDEFPTKAANPADQYPLGSVAMANTGQPHSGGSQWFVVAGAQGEALGDSYSLFGTVTSGLKVVEKINAQGSASGVPPDVTHRMLKVTIRPS